MPIKAKEMPSQQELRKIFAYNPDTGQFISLKTMELAGNIHHSGRLRLCFTFKGKYNQYAASRIAWKIVTGKEPIGHIDHINEDKLDNRFCNLREASHSQNLCNIKVCTRTKTKYKGVARTRSGKNGGTYCNTWSYSIKFNNICYSKAGFKTEEEAYLARCEHGKKLHGDYFSAGGVLSD